MTKFVLYMKGKGEGCDYTIGCNQCLMELSAASLNDAIHEVLKKLEDFNVDELEQATILEKTMEMDLSSIAKARHEAALQAKQSKVEDAERQELERLLKKYGKR